MVKTYCFDIDGTLFETHGDIYASSTPIMRRIDKLNELHRAGNRIILLTARGSKTGIDWSVFTREQMLGAGISFDELHSSKPYADFYVDDKAITDRDFFGDSS